MFRKIYFALALIILLLCAACRNNTAEVSSEYKSEIAFTENSENTVCVVYAILNIKRLNPPILIANIIYLKKSKKY